MVIPLLHHKVNIIMKITFALLAFLVAFFFSPQSQADEAHVGQVERVESRGVFVPIYAVWNKTAVASVVLYSGGGGGYGKIGEDGWPSSMNFLIRSAKIFAAHPLNVILVGRAADVSDLDGPTRIGDDHDLDNQAIFRSIKAKSTAPMWLVGTSMGTISATAAAVRDTNLSIAGIVLTTSVTAYRIKGGDGASGDPCQALHYHGFIGMEKEAVDLIAHWVLHPSI